MKLRSTAIVLLLAFTACKGETPVDPSIPTTSAANSSTALTGVAGKAVSPPPSIIVKDQNGAPMAGATVTFVVLGGGGSVRSASVTTDASGNATVTWTLGATVGANELSGTVAGLTAVTFTATATAGAPASFTESAGDNQTGVAGTAVAVRPAVTVKDANGNPTADVIVTFAVASGGGTVTGGTATTNSAGLATVGSWTLGSTPGINTLTASAPASGASVTFTATALDPPCAARTTHLLGTTTSGTLTTGDCPLPDGTFAEFFPISLATPSAYRFRESAAFDTYMYLTMSDGSVIAENDDENGTTRNSAIKALLPPGSYLIGASSFDPGVTGDFSISSSTVSTAVTGCEIVYVVKSVSTTQNVETTDCLTNTAPAPPIYGDAYFIFLRAGQSMTVTMTSSAVDSFLDLVRLDGVHMTANDNIDSTTKDARLVFTAATSTYYTIYARAAGTGQTGSYTLTIQ